MIRVAQWSWQLWCSTHAARSLTHTRIHSSASLSAPPNPLALLKSYALKLNHRFTVVEEPAAAASGMMNGVFQPQHKSSNVKSPHDW